jgi:Rps23 Pro-64 3,4-dihydroxylase Tpa1-like proline 4-hydroxylase
MFNLISIEPYIAELDSNLSNNSLDKLLKIKNYQRSRGYNPISQTEGIVLERTSFSFHDNRRKFDFISCELLDAVFQHTGHRYHLNQTEQLQITKYSPGQFYESHHDHFNLPNVPKISNDRIATIILYLNDDFEGGETIFTELNLVVQPRRGKICYFYYPPNNNLEYLKHQGSEVINGTKFIAQLWIRQESLSNN